MTASDWRHALPEHERAVYALGGHGARGGLGRRPALLVVDVTYAFTGECDEPVERAVERFPLACGPAAWRALPRIATLIDRCRAAGMPVVYTRQAPRRTAAQAGAWGRKNPLVVAASTDSADRIHDWVAPRADDIVLAKEKPSAFFGTPLVSVLNGLGTDSLLLAGTATSGCVRATAVDAFSYNYPTVVVADCTFDRVPTSHRVSLFELEAKYADVCDLDDLAWDASIGGVAPALAEEGCT